jgi:microcystin-dependent protein
MTDQFLGEIRMFGGNFAPQNWAFCNGQVIPITQNPALFSLLGTQFGGDGIRNFALPNLQGVSPIDQGDGPGLTPRAMGETGGAEAVTLTQQEMPSHLHIATASPGGGTTISPSGADWAAIRGRLYGTSTDVTMSANALSNSGGSQPHNNLAPYLVVNFIIALTGIFPARQ